MNKIEKTQLLGYLAPLLVGGLDDKYLEKMNFLDRNDFSLNMDIVFSSKEICYKELFAAILVKLKNAPSYRVIDSYRLMTIDSQKAPDRVFTSLYDLVTPKVLFIRCGISDVKLSEKIKEYIGNCMNIVIDARRSAGLNTYIFNYGTKDDFKSFGCSFPTNFITISFNNKDEVM